MKAPSPANARRAIAARCQGRKPATGAGRGVAASTPGGAGSARCRRNASTSSGSTPSTPPGPASIHCDSLRKYSNAGGSATPSILTAMIGWRFAVARSISLPTCTESTASFERRRTSTRVALSAATMLSA